MRIVDFEYAPRDLMIKRGTKVVWANRDASNHTVTFVKPPGDLGNVDSGRRVSTKFDKPGTYAYFCEYHPSMKGEITVE